MLYIWKVQTRSLLYDGIDWSYSKYLVFDEVLRHVSEENNILSRLQAPWTEQL